MAARGLLNEAARAPSNRFEQTSILYAHGDRGRVEDLDAVVSWDAVVRRSGQRRHRERETNGGARRLIETKEEEKQGRGALRAAKEKEEEDDGRGVAGQRKSRGRGEVIRKQRAQKVC